MDAPTDDATCLTHGVGAGDLVVLPPGWSGRWEVSDTVRKVYAVYWAVYRAVC